MGIDYLHIFWYLRRYVILWLEVRIVVRIRGQPLVMGEEGVSQTRFLFVVD